MSDSINIPQRSAALLDHPRVKADRVLTEIIKAISDLDRYETLSRAELALFFGIILGKFSLLLDEIDEDSGDEKHALDTLHAIRDEVHELRVQLKPESVTRFEVIDHTGRVYSIRPCKIELSYQDDGRTLKVFVELRK